LKEQNLLEKIIMQVMDSLSCHYI